jgi:hypothetical protein
VTLDAKEDGFRLCNIDRVPVFLLPVAYIESRGPAGLILRYVGQNEYSRLGIFEMSEVLENIRLKSKNLFEEDLLHIDRYQNQLDWFAEPRQEVIKIV